MLKSKLSIETESLDSKIKSMEQNYETQIKSLKTQMLFKQQEINEVRRANNLMEERLKFSQDRNLQISPQNPNNLSSKKESQSSQNSLAPIDLGIKQYYKIVDLFSNLATDSSEIVSQIRQILTDTSRYVIGFDLMTIYLGNNCQNFNSFQSDNFLQLIESLLEVDRFKENFLSDSVFRNYF